MVKVKLHSEYAQNVSLYGIVSQLLAFLYCLKLAFHFILVFIRKYYSIAINERKLSPLASLKFAQRVTLSSLLNYFAPRTELCTSFHLDDHKHSLNSNFHLFDITAHMVHYFPEVLDCELLHGCSTNCVKQ